MSASLWCSLLDPGQESLVLGRTCGVDGPAAVAVAAELRKDSAAGRRRSVDELQDGRVVGGGVAAEDERGTRRRAAGRVAVLADGEQRVDVGGERESPLPVAHPAAVGGSSGSPRVHLGGPARKVGAPQ